MTSNTKLKDKTEIKRLLHHAHLGLGDVDGIKIRNVLTEASIYEDNPMMEFFDYMSKPENFWFTCKYLLNIELLPFQLSILQELWRRKFPLLIATRGGGKTWILSLYAILRAIFHQGCKVVVIGAAFRQSKLLFEYMEQFWENSPIFRNIVGLGKRRGPKRDIDRCNFFVGGSEITAIPLGDGSKIRGLRANYIIADEFACQSYNTLVETNCGLVRIGEDDCKNKQLNTGCKNHIWESPSNYIKTPLTDVYEIKLENGYVIRCSKSHKVMTQDGWKQPLDLFYTDYIESHNQYRFPSEESISEKMAWLLGILVSEGSVVNESLISIKTTNEKLACFIMNEFGFKCHARKAYVDKRGWNCKKSFELYRNDKDLRNLLASYGLKYCKAKDKQIPNEILTQPRHIVMAFLEGLFEGDGSCFVFKDKSCDNRLGVAYYSVSETLCRDVHVLLDKLGYDGYINKRLSNLSDNNQWFVRLNGRTAYDFASQLNIDRFQLPLSNCTICDEPTNITWDKSRNKWKCQIIRLGKTIQKRFNTKNEAEQFILDVKSLPRFRRVVSVTKLQKQEHLYDYHLPQTHSFYAGGSRQHNSIPQEVYEVVIKGFGAVSADVVGKVKEEAQLEIMRSLGFTTEAEEIEEDADFGNQTIISGTAYFHFNHLFDYFERFRNIVRSCGNTTYLEEHVFHGPVPDNFDWQKYSVIRIPNDMLPRGFLDEEQISQAEATIQRSLFMMEYKAVFAKDSEGFYRRSLLESCVTQPENSPKQVVIPTGEAISFDAAIYGHPNKKYIYGIDPASESDNFSIVILEVEKGHRRIVYSWAVTRQKLRERIKTKGEAQTVSFYNYCARKIRELMKVFPTDHIAIDAQGGGRSIMEALHDKQLLLEGEQPIWPYIVQGDTDPCYWEKFPKETDGEAGKHILHAIEFAKQEFTNKANHNLRKDFESKVVLFPKFDTVLLSEAIEQDAVFHREYDTLEDCVLEIETLKDELTSIQHTQTPGGRDKWDTPETVLAGGRKGRMRKDRYSALLMANEVAHVLEQQLEGQAYVHAGGFAGQERKKSPSNRLYTGPEHIVSAMGGIYGMGVRKR